jgi:DNA invertase Pin-like site-specific DNA recombinase
MPTRNFVAYYRVSTEKQGRSGLGLDAQRAAVESYLNGGDWKMVAEFVEVESGKRSDNRPQLQAAMTAARIRNATLIIAKLDRLSRDAHFLLGLQKSGVDFICADMPDANKMSIGILALVAQHEREQISARTKAALAAAKARGTKADGSLLRLGGNPASLKNRDIGSKRGNAVKAAKAAARVVDLRPQIEDIRTSGCTSLRQIAGALNERGIVAPRGGDWSAPQVRTLLQRLDGIAA